jgi:hypothetical protein
MIPRRDFSLFVGQEIGPVSIPMMTQSGAVPGPVTIEEIDPIGGGTIGGGPIGSGPTPPKKGPVIVYVESQFADRYKHRPSEGKGNYNNPDGSSGSEGGYSGAGYLRHISEGGAVDGTGNFEGYRTDIQPPGRKRISPDCPPEARSALDRAYQEIFGNGETAERLHQLPVHIWNCLVSKWNSLNEIFCQEPSDWDIANQSDPSASIDDRNAQLTISTVMSPASLLMQLLLSASTTCLRSGINVWSSTAMGGTQPNPTWTKKEVCAYFKQLHGGRMRAVGATPDGLYLINYSTGKMYPNKYYPNLPADDDEWREAFKQKYTRQDGRLTCWGGFPFK